MNSIKDYLRENGPLLVIAPSGEYSLSLNGEDVVLRVCGNIHLISGESVEDEIIAILDGYGIGIRFCQECGKPIDSGFSDDEGSFCSCDKCFEKHMNNVYGKDLWRASAEGEYRGYYQYMDGGEWHDTGVYWTTWRD